MIESIFQKLLKSVQDKQHLSFVANIRLLLRFLAFTMISSFQSITGLGLSEPCTVSLSKWIWYGNIWTCYLCNHHSNSRISLTPELFSGSFWSDKISQYNFFGAESFTCTAKWSVRKSIVMYFLNKSCCFSVLEKYHSDNSLDTFAFHLSWWMRKGDGVRNLNFVFEVLQAPLPIRQYV